MAIRIPIILGTDVHEPLVAPDTLDPAAMPPCLRLTDVTVAHPGGTVTITAPPTPADPNIYVMESGDFTVGDPAPGACNSRLTIINNEPHGDPVTFTVNNLNGVAETLTLKGYSSTDSTSTFGEVGSGESITLSWDGTTYRILDAHRRPVTITSAHSYWKTIPGTSGNPDGINDDAEGIYHSGRASVGVAINTPTFAQFQIARAMGSYMDVNGGSIFMLEDLTMNAKMGVDNGVNHDAFRWFNYGPNGIGGKDIEFQTAVANAANNFQFVLKVNGDTRFGRYVTGRNDGVADNIAWFAADGTLRRSPLAAAGGAAKFRVVQNLVAGANVITHNLALTNTAVIVEVRDNTTGELTVVSVTNETANSVTLTVSMAATGQRITIIG